MFASDMLDRNIVATEVKEEVVERISMPVTVISETLDKVSVSTSSKFQSLDESRSRQLSNS